MYALVLDMPSYGMSVLMVNTLAAPSMLLGNCVSITYPAAVRLFVVRAAISNFSTKSAQLSQIPITLQEGNVYLNVSLWLFYDQHFCDS